MKIVKETSMKAEIILGVDRNGAEQFVLVIKGTFDLPPDGSVPQLATTQEDLIYADQYYGDPATTSIQYAYDFALRKPMTDVVVVGSAYAPRGTRARAVRVSLKVGDIIDKTIQVVGDRKWDLGLLAGLHPTEPEMFERIPLAYERAFGGSDTSHGNPKRHGFHRENLVGVGLHANTDPAYVMNKPLPNLQHPRHPIVSWGDATPTIGFGFISPGWKPRIDYAGTCDDAYLETRYPLVPDDFDEMFFQAAPADQIVPYLRGGERVTLTNLSPHGELSFPLPTVELPVVFMYSDRADEHYRPNLDGVTIAPDIGKLFMIWRTVVRRVGKPYALRQVVVGTMSDKWWERQRSFKPHYASLEEFIQSRARF